MPTVNLTDRKIDSLKPESATKYWYDTKIKGLGIRISSKGTKTWFLHYRFAGARPRMRLGRYPEVRLATARKKAQKALAILSDGNDPAKEKKAQQAEQKRERLDAKTFAQLSRQYLEDYAKPYKRSWKEDERIISKLLNPQFGSINVKDITRSHIRTHLRGLAAKTPVQANRTLACIRKIFNWAIKEEVVDIEANPAYGISSPGGREKSKERNLSDGELKAVWNELETDTTPLKRVLQLILLTGQRPGEVVALPWDELNMTGDAGAIWTLPGNRAKNRMANLVPLSTQAVRILGKQRNDLESKRQKREKRGQNADASVFVFPCRHLAKNQSMTVYAIDQEAQRISKELAIPGFTPHDLRRTCSTKLGELGVPGHIIDRILNHKLPGMTDRVYNRYDYLKEKREALDELGARIAKLASG